VLTKNEEQDAARRGNPFDNNIYTIGRAGWRGLVGADFRQREVGIVAEYAHDQI
jgi:hypothetical protein